MNFNLHQQHTWLVCSKTGTAGTRSLRMSLIKRNYVWLADHREATIYSRVGPSWSHPCLGKLRRSGPPVAQTDFPGSKLIWSPRQVRHSGTINEVKWNTLGGMVVSYQWSNKFRCCSLTINKSNTKHKGCFILMFKCNVWIPARLVTWPDAKPFHSLLKISSEKSIITLKSVIKHFFQA